MKRSSLVGHTVELLDAYRAGHQPADAVLRQFHRARGYLGARDRRTIAEWYFGILRNFTLLEFYASESLRVAGSPLAPGMPPSAAILVALFVRILHEDPSLLGPDVAPVWKASKWGAALDRFLAALLTVALPDEVLGKPIQRLAVEQSIAGFIVAEWAQEFGVEEAERLCFALNRPAPTTIRVNTLKTNRDVCTEALAREGVDTEPTQLSSVGLVLKKKVDVNTLASFRKGWFELQDEGSQIVTMLLEPRGGQCIVDACAGGGGKTLHIGALLGNQGRIIAIDTDDRRLSEIPPRIARAGVTIVRKLHGERDSAAVSALEGTADAVLVDAPCSGVGTFRRNPGAKTRVTESWVDELCCVQSALLERYAVLVKPGGRLVYSTCTLLRKENEERVKTFLTQRRDFILLRAGEILKAHGVNLPDESEYLKLLPHLTGTDGFFAAVLKREQ